MFRADDVSTRIRVGKVPFEVTNIDKAVNRVIRASLDGEAIPFRLSNAYCVALASNDAAYESLLNGRGLNFPDGTPVVWVMKLRRERTVRPGHVRGPSLFRNTLDQARQHGIRHFLLGTDEATLVKLASRLETNLPGIQLSGTYPPPFGPVDEAFIAECVSRIQDTDAQLVWVALGTPKQDFVAAELSRRLKLPCIGIGAAFDFEAGVTNEAPSVLQKVGLEWAYRFACEPKRLWRRYLFGNIRFVYTAVLERAKQGRVD